MLIRRLSLTNYLHRHRSRLLTTAQPPPPLPPPLPPSGPVNETQLLKVCTILYQQQNSLDTKLHSKLSSCDFNSTHEFFLQVCNKFPYSWRPVYRFFLYTHQQSTHQFCHTPVTYNKMLSVIARSRNIELLWSVVREMGKLGFVNVRTYVIVVKTLALAREMKKCVGFFYLMEVCGYGSCVDRFNLVIRVLCKEKLVVEAKYVVMKMKEFVRVDGFTYGLLVKGFCDVGDLIEASKIWNLMVDEGFDVGVDVVEKMIETFFKTNEDGEAMKLFEEMCVRRIDDLGVSTYGIVIHWLCKSGKISQAKMVFDEMRERGFEADNSILASVVYGLLVRRRVDEAYKVVEGIERLDINIYHALIRGLLRLKRASEATQIFREMIKRRCEPTMHTYIMLLQGHLGKKGRKERDPVVNFDTVFVGGLVKAGKLLEATKFVERLLMGGVEVPRFDYCKFLHYFSSEEGVVMFEEVSKKLREAGMIDLADILQRYGEKMATRDRRRNWAIEPIL